jgi:hypothetical protein
LSIEIIAIIIAISSLSISILTLWLTLLRKGTVRMTQPTMLFFGRDAEGMSKIFLRTLLYSTSKRNQIIESMFVKVKRGESIQNFNLWVYGDDDHLSRGSGINISPDGLTCNHHFLTPKDGTTYNFLAGDYEIEVYASLIGLKSPILLSTINLFLGNNEAIALKNDDVGIFFNWGPDSKKYHASIDIRPEKQ